MKQFFFFLIEVLCKHADFLEKFQQEKKKDKIVLSQELMLSKTTFVQEFWHLT